MCQSKKVIPSSTTEQIWKEGSNAKCPDPVGSLQELLRRPINGEWSPRPLMALTYPVSIYLALKHCVDEMSSVLIDREKCTGLVQHLCHPRVGTVGEVYLKCHILQMQTWGFIKHENVQQIWETQGNDNPKMINNSCTSQWSSLFCWTENITFLVFTCP